MRHPAVAALLTLALGCAFATEAAAQNSYQQQIRNQLRTASDTVRQHGYAADREPMMGSLNASANESMQVNLQGGVRYAIIGVCETLADQGRRVIVAGLDQDYRGIPFPVTSQLMGVAEFVTKNLAICSVCGSPANRSQRLSNTKKLIEVGTGDKYEARCRACFRR